MADIATRKGEVVFAAEQTDIDTFVMPTSSGTILVTSPPEFNQEPVIAENDEMTDSYAEQPGSFCGYNMGQFKITCNFKMSGSPGVLSPIHPLLLSWRGRHTVNSGVDVRYYHYRKDVDPKVYLSFVVKKQLYTEYITGAVVNSGDLKVVAKKIQTIEFNGLFKKKVRAGRALLLSQIDGTTTPVTELPFKDAEDYKNFDVDAYCAVGTDDNSGAGFKILSIDETNNKMTIEDGVTTVQEADAIIKGFTPVAVESGVDATSEFGWVTLNTGAAGDRDVAITEAAYKSDNGFKALDDIAYDSDFTGEVGTDSRKVTIDITKYFTIKDLGADFDIKNQTDIVVKLNIGKESGASAVIEMPKTRVLKASESGSPEVKKQPSHQCYPDTGDDESTLILK